MLTSQDVGRRVSVRRRVDESATDAVGHLLDLTDTDLQVLRKDGEVAVVPVADVIAAKVVPRRPVRRGWEVPAVSTARMQSICSAGWPARETEHLGEWLLRTHGGITGRANSAMAIGDPGRPVPAALDAVSQWYVDRGVPPLLQLPLADPVNLAMADLGWQRQHVTIVQVAPVAALLSSLPRRDDLTASVTPTPTPEWLALMHDLDTGDPETHVAILTGPEVVGFATLLRGDEPVGIGRVSVEGDWAGVTSVDVAPAARRQGIASAVMRTLVGWAGERGAQATYLQVRAANDAALRLYAALGYVTHHLYVYRAPTPGQGRSTAAWDEGARRRGCSSAVVKG
jgi:ribosomal protein S18 acetylase RimI-like enzyme